MIYFFKCWYYDRMCAYHVRKAYKLKDYKDAMKYHSSISRYYIHKLEKAMGK